MTIYPPTIEQDLRDYHVFLDTNVFIYASKNQEFFNFLTALNNQAGCSFTTVPSVLFEFTNGSDSPDAYAKRVQFLKDVVDNVDPLTFLNDIPDFYVVMSKINGKNKSYTDYLLAACLYNYRRSKTALITTDVNGFPPFFPRTQIVTVEHKKDIVNFGVFEFDSANYAKAAKAVLDASAA